VTSGSSEALPIVLLTRAGCSLCDQAAELLDRLSAQYPLTVMWLDIDTAAGQELAARCGVLYIPAIVSGSEALAESGISERRLRREIERRLGLANSGDPREVAPQPRWRGLLERFGPQE
jgi:hypothetical protein